MRQALLATSSLNILHLLLLPLLLPLVNAIAPRLPARPVQFEAANIPPRPAERPNALNLREEAISGGVEAAISLLGQEVFPTSTATAFGSSGASGFSSRPTTATGLFTFDGGFDTGFSVVGRQVTDLDDAFTELDSAFTDFDSAFTDLDSAFTDFASASTPLTTQILTPTPTLFTSYTYSWPTFSVPITPAPTPTFIPSCPRAQVYINYCAHWYGAAAWSSTATQAYCLCLGPAPSSSLVYVPDIFDGDVAACASGYVTEAAFWGGLVGNGTEGEGEGWEVYGGFEAEALSLAGEWEGAVGFCAVNGKGGGDGGGGVVGGATSSVPPEYFLGSDGAGGGGEDEVVVEDMGQTSGAGLAVDWALRDWGTSQVIGFVGMLLAYILAV